ncbi:MAG: hypothetical protein ACFFCS_22490 [Candidatus Hodarchaeota archaeon]
MAMNLMLFNDNIPFWEQHGGTIIFLSIVIAIVVVYLVKKGIPSLIMNREAKKIEFIRKKQENALSIKEKPVVDESSDIGELSDLEMVDTYLLMHMNPPDILELNIGDNPANPVVKKDRPKLLAKAVNIFKRPLKPKGVTIVDKIPSEVQDVPPPDAVGRTRVDFEDMGDDDESDEDEGLSLKEYESQKAFILGSAVEYEALGKIEQAMEYYKKAKALAEEMENSEDIELFENKIKKLQDPWGAWR